MLLIGGIYIKVRTLFVYLQNLWIPYFIIYGKNNY